MIQSGMNSALIYVFDKTGFVPSEMNKKKFSPEGRHEIDEAFNEFYESPEDFAYLLEDYSDLEFENNPDMAIPLYIFGNYIDRNFNGSQLRIGFNRIVTFYLVLRSYRIIRSIWKLTFTSSPEEKYILVRSLFENYCKLCFIDGSESRSKLLFEIDYGMAMGDFEFDKKGDRIVRNRIRRISTGEVIQRDISFFKMISYSKIAEDYELFEPTYEFLSSFAHSGIRHIFKDFDQEKFEFVVGGRWEEDLEAIPVRLMTGMVASMIMQKMHHQKGVSAVSKRDIEYYCRVVKLMSYETGVNEESGNTENEKKTFRCLLARMKKLPSRRLHKIS